ncbi:MAG: hypothetical protein Q6373_021090 [Candidatus Sigynarchaeota archaeon]
MALAIVLIPIDITLRRVGKQSVIDKYKLGVLSLLLWGGVIMLALEHVAHQEIVPFFPFLTAMNDPADAAVMFYEMATLGTSMLFAIVGVWAIIVIVSAMLVKIPSKAKKAQVIIG